MDKFLVQPDSKIDLNKIPTCEDKTFKVTKEQAIELTKQMNLELDKLQKVQHAEKKHKILIVFQGLDASGKDGAIRNVFSSVNPSGVYVAHFGAPTSTELSYDFLWRIHKKVPAKGEIVIFNRSHYEDVLIVRVQKLMSAMIWKKRFKHINSFEEMLFDEGTTILKFYLHISFDEQRDRLQDRVDNPEKHWKIDPQDFKDRQKWGSYIEAYNDVLESTSTRYAPWYIIPSDKKWYRDYLITSILTDKLRAMKMKYPEARADYTGLIVK